MSERTNPAKCPNLSKGLFCDVCGGTYICTEPWRKKRTAQQRIKARAEFRKRVKEQA